MVRELDFTDRKILEEEEKLKTEMTARRLRLGKLIRESQIFEVEGNDFMVEKLGRLISLEVERIEELKKRGFIV